jgi:hypothetical protein
MSFTALSATPSDVNVLIKFNPESNNPFKPIPAVPIRMATNLPRMSVINILKTCTPPKMEVAFMIELYDDLVSDTKLKINL